MKKISTLAIFAFFLLHIAGAQAQTSKNDFRWGAEFNLIWPFVPGVEIYTAKFTKNIWRAGSGKGDVLFGFLVRPGTENDPNAEIFEEYGVGIGYRHFFKKGFHAELMLFPSYARETANKVDGKDYSSFAMTTELYSGYKFDLIQKDSYHFYLMPQAGIGMNVFSNLGPETASNAPFPVFSLQAGFNF